MLAFKRDGQTVRGEPDMLSEKESTVLRGILRGQGYEVSCVVSASIVRLPGSNAVAYIDYAIDVREPVPDGFYQLLTNGAVIRMRRYNDNWFCMELN